MKEFFAETLLGISIFIGYSIGYWFIKLVTFGKYPRGGFISDAEDWEIYSLGFAVLTIVLYLFAGQHVVLIMGGIIVGIISIIGLMGRFFGKYLNNIKLPGWLSFTIFIILFIVAYFILGYTFNKII